MHTPLSVYVEDMTTEETPTTTGAATFLAEYRLTLDAMYSTVKARMSSEPFMKAFSSMTGVQQFEYLFDHNLHQIRNKRHPNGNGGLLELAHILILLWQYHAQGGAQPDIARHPTMFPESLLALLNKVPQEARDQIIDIMTARAKVEAQAQTDAEVMMEIRIAKNPDPEGPTWVEAPLPSTPFAGHGPVEPEPKKASKRVRVSKKKADLKTVLETPPKKRGRPRKSL